MKARSLNDNDYPRYADCGDYMRVSGQSSD